MDVVHLAGRRNKAACGADQNDGLQEAKVLPRDRAVPRPALPG